MPAPRAPPSLVKVVDRALPPSLFARLARAVRALGAAGLSRTYQTTFWFDLGDPAALPEVAARALRARLPAPPRGGIAGVEWWLSRMRTSDVQVDFHRDRDERLFLRRGVTRHPAISSVLFLNRCRGGLLVVTARAARDANPSRAPDRLDDADLVRPWPNRLAIFPGDATHGVLDARNRVPDAPLAVATPLRLALVMNWWSGRPAGIPRFDETRRYRGLALPRNGRAPGESRRGPARRPDPRGR